MDKTIFTKKYGKESFENQVRKAWVETMSSDEKSKLQKLPTEVRIQLYKHFDHEVIVIYTNKVADYNASLDPSCFVRTPNGKVVKKDYEVDMIDVLLQSAIEFNINYENEHNEI